MIPGQQEQCESSVGGGLASTSLSLVVQNVTPVAVPSIVDKANPFQAAVVKVTPAVVEIKVIGVRAFDTCNAGTWKATGFVVDKAEGIILTNRHVIGPGPEVREAVFHNQEEVALEVIYTDPVHDFGFYRFNPKDVNFTEIAEIPLAPERAEIGVDIKVIGNDEGEKLSILSGILARLDRNAPNYGTGYNDFNTFYYQASSSTSGGSSGSPVIDIDGYAIALNAGGSNRGASSFFLPLDRVTRALDFIKRGLPVPRGTIQTVFKYRPFHELRRQSITEDIEHKIRLAFPDAMGMLQVEKTIPSGPADKMLLPGDILFSVNGVATSTFIVLETVLDDGVGKDIVLEVRRAGAMLTVTIPIQDLHTITPTSFLEFAGDIMHDMSYQLARSYLVPCKGVHVAFAGYMMRDIGSHSLILSVDHIHTPTTADLAKVLATLPDGKHTPVRHRSLSDKEHEKTTVVQVDRKYFPASLYRRSATAYGQWESEPIPMPPKVEPKLLYGEANLKMSALNEMSARIATSLATVESHVPYAVLDAYYRHNKGCGVVLDAEQGLMLVDRHTVPGFFGTITVTFSNKIKIPAELVYQHPIHNFGVIKYNPSHIGKTPVRSIELCKESMQPGKEVHLGCMEWNNKIKARDISVSDVVPSAMGMRWPAGFFETNTDLVKVAAGSTKGRVLVNSAGQMLSFLAQHTVRVQHPCHTFPCSIN